jgi:salicylate hydroxylase
MAFEDAVCLADCVAQAERRFDKAFERFCRLRLVRTARIQLGSRALWEDYHVGGVARDVRNAVWGERGEAGFFDCLKWIYDDPSVPSEA